jgi:hypothetical protein
MRKTLGKSRRDNLRLRPEKQSKQDPEKEPAHRCNECTLREASLVSKLGENRLGFDWSVGSRTRRADNLEGNCCYQAFAQVCAFYSLKTGSMMIWRYFNSY